MAKNDMYINIKSGVGRLAVIQSRTPTVAPLRVPVESAKAIVKMNVTTAVEVNPENPEEEIPLTLENIEASSDPLVKIGHMPYSTIQKAVDASKPGDVLVLMRDATGDGVMVPEDKDFTLDFATHTYTINDKTVGMPGGTTTLGFRFEKGSKVVLKNGTINAGEHAKMVIQKYNTLDIEDMTLIGGPQTQYVLSNNNGVTTLKNNTNITASGENCAFDVYYWPEHGFGDVYVKTENLTGKITGKLEHTHDSSTSDEEMKAHSGFQFNSGTFTAAIKPEWCVEGFAPKDNQDGTYTVVPAEQASPVE